MKIGKLDIKRWTYNGMKLSNPALILWRLIWFVPIGILACLLYLCFFVSQGKYSADMLWRDIF